MQTNTQAAPTAPRFAITNVTIRLLGREFGCVAVVDLEIGGGIWIKRIALTKSRDESYRLDWPWFTRNGKKTYYVSPSNDTFRNYIKDCVVDAFEQMMEHDGELCPHCDHTHTANLDSQTDGVFVCGACNEPYLTPKSSPGVVQ